MARLARRYHYGTGWRLRNGADAVNLFVGDLSGLASEELRVAHLDKEGRVLGLSAGAGGHPERIDLPIGEIVRDALTLGARALVLAHNHPSGDPTPSRADKAATRRLADVARNLDIRLLDHLIFANERWQSFRQMGLL